LPSRDRFISGGIYEQIKHKLVCGYESLGDRKVKNITDPVRVYRVLPDPAAFYQARRRRETILIFLLSLVLLVIAGSALWYLLPRQGTETDRIRRPPRFHLTCRGRSSTSPGAAASVAFALVGACHPGSRA
jgi:hypothetical protein